MMWKIKVQMRKLQLKPALLHPKEIFVTPPPKKKICIIGKSESYKYCQDIDQNWNNVFQIIN